MDNNSEKRKSGDNTYIVDRNKLNKKNIQYLMKMKQEY